ncbi:hypothetical protein PGT21_012960 [Puccinia graminis f. sp. tritici]|uniref:Uncharacterized protein n=1 Tax=Puccinia graminis f. sp. tritici TaxID=56615 RepID=A0A5B0PU00_PUCGR|nr:hypothetical protein PGT21_012960 [Puccinia graminis f. sp. tritici]
MDVTSLLNNGSATNSNEEPNLEENHLEERQSERSRLSERTTIRTTPESRDRPAGLQRGDDPRYQLSAAATERLRKLKLQSTSDQRNRYENTSGGSAAVGLRRLSSPHQFTSNLSSFGNNVQPIHSSTTPGRTPEFRSPYEYRDRASDSISDPSSVKSDPYPSDGSVPGSGRPGSNNSGQRATRDNHQLVQRSVANVCPSKGAPQRPDDALCAPTSCWQPRELADLERAERDNPTPQVQRLAITQRAHSNTISPSPAPLPLNTPDLRNHVPGSWPTTSARPTSNSEAADSSKPPLGSRKPFASTPATIYSTPTSFSLLQSAQASTTPPVLSSRMAPSTNNNTPSNLFRTTMRTSRHKWPRLESLSEDSSTPTNKEIGEDTGGTGGLPEIRQQDCWKWEII